MIYNYLYIMCKEMLNVNKNSYEEQTITSYTQSANSALRKLKQHLIW